MRHFSADQGELVEFVSIEIRADVLRRLIIDHKIAVSQLHCANQGSKLLVHNALLDGLKASL